MNNQYTRYTAILFFILVEFMYGFELTYIKMSDSMHNFLLILSIFLFLLSTITGKWNLRELYKVFVMLIIAMGVYISSGETLFLMMVLAAILINNISYKIAMKTMFGVRIIVLFMVISSSLVGIIPMNKMQITKGNFGSYIGYGLGYQHPNNLAQAIFVLCLLYIAIRNLKITKLNIFSIFVIDGLTYLITGNKTTFFILIFICLCLFFRNNYWIKKVIYSWSLPYLLIVITFWILIPMMYAKSGGILKNIAYSLNGLLNGRFSNSSMMFDSFSISWFGKIVNLDYLRVLYGYNVVDNGYVFMLFDYGLIGVFSILFWYFCAVKQFIKKEKYTYLLILVGFLTLGLMENVIRAMFMNFTMIFWYEFIKSDKYLNYKKDGIYH